MLPDGSGFDVCRELRARSEVPIIMLTARGDETDRVVGLELGADDYVSSRSARARWSARMRAVLRRAEAGRRPPPAAGADRGRRLRLDPGAAQATLAGRGARALAQGVRAAAAADERRRPVVTRERLIDEVWDMNWFGSTKTLDVHVTGLRRKLGDDPVRAALPAHRARRRLPLRGAEECGER